jgi:hypothetical protein
MQVSQGLNNLANSKPKTSIREDESELLQQNCAILKTNEKAPPLTQNASWVRKFCAKRKAESALSSTNEKSVLSR